MNPRTAQQQEMAAMRAEIARLGELVSSLLMQRNGPPPVAGPTTSYEYGANKENADPACPPTRRLCDDDHASSSSSSSASSYSAFPPNHLHTGSSTMPVASLVPTYNNPRASPSAVGTGPRGLLGGGNGGYHGGASSSPAAIASAGTSPHFQHHGILGGNGGSASASPSLFLRNAMNTTRGGTVGGGGVGQPTHHRGVLGGGFVETPAQATMSFTVPHALGVDNARGSSTASGNNAQPPASSSSSYGRTAPENSEDEGDFNK